MLNDRLPFWLAATVMALDTGKPRTTVQREGLSDLSRGFLTREVTPGIFVLTNGNYQSLIITTGDGVVLVDAPEPLARFIPPAVADLTSEPIRTLIYSHGHSDHIGGAGLLEVPSLEIIAEGRVARFLADRKDGRRLAPTVTFDEHTTLRRGSRIIDLKRDEFHSPEGDLIIYLSPEKVLMVIDFIAPGWVPLLDFDITSNMFAYLGMFDRVLAYDFQSLIGGHTADIARRADVEITKRYAFDVYETVKRVHAETDVAALLAEERDSEQAGIKRLIEQVTNRAAAEVKSRWQGGPMKGVDIWTESHCRAMLLYVRWSD
jgi:glyoxylase-like metal-dependent hydrolase (beta-lactamase superfamily II)